MAVKTKTKVRDSMKTLELREVDRKRYEDWMASRNKNVLYRSFIRVGSTLSIGRKHRFWCDKQNRIVELLSDGEYRAYKYLIWLPGVVAVEEQFALNPQTTFEIAKTHKVIHPYDYKRHIHHIMTTDFLVTTADSDGVCTQQAYSYKPYFNENTLSRTLQKLAIEAAYWRLRDVTCPVLTAAHISNEWIKTLSFCELHYDSSLELNRLLDFSMELLSLHQQDPWAPLRGHLKCLASLLSKSYGEVERLFKNSVLRGFVPVSQQERMRLNESLTLA
jgi:hypothetical protein